MAATLVRMFEMTYGELERRIQQNDWEGLLAQQIEYCAAELSCRDSKAQTLAVNIISLRIVTQCGGLKKQVLGTGIRKTISRTYY